MDKPLLSNRVVAEAAGMAYTLGVIGLSLLGIAGVIYHTLSPEGVLSPKILGLWGRHPFFATLVLIGLVAMMLAARTGELGARAGRGSSDLSLYVFVALGTFFAGRILVFGSF
jgi:hypothetical protein